AANHLDAAALAVADVTAVDVRLVQVDAVEEDSHAAAVIDMAAVDDQVTVALGQADAVAHLADQHAGQGGLHDAHEFDAVGVGVGADDFQPLHLRHALALPDAGLERGGVGAAGVGADEAEGGAGAGHDDAAGAALPREADRAVPRQVDRD